MAVIQRITDFIPNTLIVSQEVDDEFNQLVNLLSGVSTNKDTLLKYSHATDPVLRVDQLGAGVVQQWLQNGTVKSRINNNGSLESIAGPVIAASQLIAAPLTIDGATDIVLKSNGFIVGYSKTILVDSSTVGNVGTGQDNLHTPSIAANILATNGDYVDFEFSGSFTNNDDNKRVGYSVGGTVVEDTGLIDIDSLGWTMRGRIIRLTSTSVRVTSFHNQGVQQIDSAAAVSATGIGSRSTQRTSDITGLSDLGANSLAIVVFGESATATNDNVQQKLTILQATQMA